MSAMRRAVAGVPIGSLLAVLLWPAADTRPLGPSPRDGPAIHDTVGVTSRGYGQRVGAASSARTAANTLAPYASLLEESTAGERDGAFRGSVVGNSTGATSCGTSCSFACPSDNGGRYCACDGVRRSQDECCWTGLTNKLEILRNNGNGEKCRFKWSPESRKCQKRTEPCFCQQAYEHKIGCSKDTARLCYACMLPSADVVLSDKTSSVGNGGRGESAPIEDVVDALRVSSNQTLPTVTAAEVKTFAQLVAGDKSYTETPEFQVWRQANCLGQWVDISRIDAGIIRMCLEQFPDKMKAMCSQPEFIKRTFPYFHGVNKSDWDNMQRFLQPAERDSEDSGVCAGLSHFVEKSPGSILLRPKPDFINKGTTIQVPAGYSQSSSFDGKKMQQLADYGYMVSCLGEKVCPVVAEMRIVLGILYGAEYLILDSNSSGWKKQFENCDSVKDAPAAPKQGLVPKEAGKEVRANQKQHKGKHIDKVLSAGAKAPKFGEPKGLDDAVAAPSVVSTITVDGFTDNGVVPRKFLNRVYTKRSVTFDGQTTYWSADGEYFCFWCEKTNLWGLAPRILFDTKKCNSFATTHRDADIYKTGTTFGHMTNIKAGEKEYSWVEIDTTLKNAPRVVEAVDVKAEADWTVTVQGLPFTPAVKDDVNDPNGIYTIDARSQAANCIVDKCSMTFSSRGRFHISYVVRQGNASWVLVDDEKAANSCRGLVAQSASQDDILRPGGCAFVTACDPAKGQQVVPMGAKALAKLPKAELATSPEAEMASSPDPEIATSPDAEVGQGTVQENPFVELVGQRCFDRWPNSGSDKCPSVSDWASCSKKRSCCEDMNKMLTCLNSDQPSCAAWYLATIVSTIDWPPKPPAALVNLTAWLDACQTKEPTMQDITERVKLFADPAVQAKVCYKLTGSSCQQFIAGFASLKPVIDNPQVAKLTKIMEGQAAEIVKLKSVVLKQGPSLLEQRADVGNEVAKSLTGDADGMDLVANRISLRMELDHDHDNVFGDPNDRYPTNPMDQETADVPL